LDWSVQNQIGVSLSNTIYLWGADSGSVIPLVEDQTNPFTSLKFSPSGHHILLASTSGKSELWDIARNKIINTYTKHSSRVGSMTWNNSNVFATGSKDKSILI
jgi:WD40 repeat protein